MSLNATTRGQIEEKQSRAEPSWRNSTIADERRAVPLLFLIGKRDVRVKVKFL
jgi:hypothetical protein